MKKYQTAKELLATKAENKEKKPIYATRKLSIGLVSCMLGLLMAAPIARAEELPPAPGVEAAGQKEAPAKVEEDLLTEAEIKEIQDRALNLGDNKYVFTSYRVNELKERLRKIKAENPDNFAKLKKDAIDNAIIEFSQVPRGEEREIKTLVAPSITGTLEAGDKSISVKFDKNKDVVTINKLGGDFYAYVNVNGIDNIIKLKYITKSFKIKLTTGLKVDKQVSVKIVVTEKNNNRKILGESPYSNKVTVAKKSDPMDVTYANISMPTDVTIYYDNNDNPKVMLLNAIKKANNNLKDFAKNARTITKYTADAEGNVIKATIKYKDNALKEYDISGIKLIKKEESSLPNINDIQAGSKQITGKFNPAVKTNTEIRLYINLKYANLKPDSPYIKGKIDGEGNVTFDIPKEKN